MAKQWFISDLHLAIERPRTLTLFEHFLRTTPQAGDRLYILGDLFDVWIGDDDDAELAQRVRKALRAASDRGIDILIQQGNRDFMMGKRLMHDCGARLLRDHHIAVVAGEPTLLMHGDLLCTDDVDYQKTRRKYRNPIVQWLIRRKPLHERRRKAAEYRRRSGEMTALKPADIMDVNNDAVLQHFAKYRVRRMIHGHTHRPDQHEHRLPDGNTATRIVLPEWHAEGTHVWVDDGSALRQQPISAAN